MAVKIKTRIVLVDTVEEEVDGQKTMSKVWRVVNVDAQDEVIGYVTDHYVPTIEGAEDGAYKGWTRSHLTAEAKGENIDVTKCTTRAQTVSAVRRAFAA